MRRIQILGGGPGQLNLIKRTAQLGYKTIVSDRNPDAPGINLADYPSTASSFSRDEVKRDALRFSADFLMTAGTDQPVLTAARVSHDLRLPYFLTPDQALMVTNKAVMKEAMEKAHIPQRRFALLKGNFSDGELGHLSFPLVIKPLDSQGQRGVLKVDSPRQIRELFPYVLSFSRERRLLAEEYYQDARELTISGWAEGGTAHILSITDRVTVDNGPHIGVCVCHRYPSVRHHDWDILARLTQRITAMVGVERGPLYFQILYGSQGYAVNEIACRLGGAYEDEFLPWLSGVPLLDYMIEMTGKRSYNREQLSQTTRCREGKYLSLEMFFYHPGAIHSQTGMEDLLTSEGILGGRFLLPVGTEILSRDNSTQRAGYFIVTGKSPEQLGERISASYKKIRVRDEGGRNLLCRFQNDHIL